MKKIIVLLEVLLFFQLIDAVTVKPTDQITCAVRTIYNDGNLAAPDSVRVQVFRNGVELSDGWYNSADAEASLIDGWLVFTDQLQDIDGAGGDGQYLVLSRAYDNDSALYTPYIYNYKVGLDINVESISGDSNAADSLEAMLDGSGSTLHLNQLRIESSGNDTALYIKGSGTGLGIFAEGGASSKAVLFKAGTSSGGAGLEIIGGGVDGSAVIFTGNGSGVDFDVDISGNLSGSVNSVANPVVAFDTVSTGDTLAVKKDSLLYRNAQSGFAAEIADSLYGRDSLLFNEGFWHKIANRSDSGNYGGGSGVFSYNLVTYDSSVNQVVPGVKVSIQNLDQSALIAFGYTGNDGSFSSNLFADSFLVNLFAPGYTFNPFDTIIVSANYNDTLLGYQFNPGTPASPDLCRVYGYVYDINGLPEANADLTVSLPGGVVRYNSTIISPFKKSVTSDSNGYFSIDLIPSDSLNPVGQEYEFTISRSDGTFLRQRLEVPATGVWQLTW